MGKMFTRLRKTTTARSILPIISILFLFICLAGTVSYIRFRAHYTLKIGRAHV